MSFGFFSRESREERLQKWATEAVGFYRTLGFFNECSDLSDKDLALKLTTLEKAEWDTPINPKDKVADLQLLRWDEQRIWWQDLEADVFAGNNVYIQALSDWKHISRGMFNPTNIEELWEGEEGPIKIRFRLNDEQHCLEPKYLDDWMDSMLLTQINNLVTHSNLKFEVCKTFGQSAFVVVLSPEDKRLIQKERRLQFETF